MKPQIGAKRDSFELGTPTWFGQSTFSSGLMAREFPVRLSAELDGVDGL